MAQLAVAWEDHLTLPGGGANPGDPWWPLLDETPFDDATTQYGPISGGTGFSVKAFRTRLNGPIYDPGVHTGHIIRIRANCTVQVGSNWKIIWTLAQQGGSTIFTNNASPVTMTQGWATYTATLSTGQAGLITDYSALILEVSFTQFSSGDGGEVYVSAIELEFPDAAATDGTFADNAEGEEAFDAQIVDSISFDDEAEAFEDFGASVGSGRLVAQGRRFRVVRTVVELQSRSVEVVGRGR